MIPQQSGGLWVPARFVTSQQTESMREYPWEPGVYEGTEFGKSMSPPDGEEEPICRMCGMRSPSSVEHIPPRSVLPHKPREIDRWRDGMDEDIPHERRYKGDPMTGAHSVICRSCNNTVGSTWATAYKDFCQKMMLAVACHVPAAMEDALSARMVNEIGGGEDIPDAIRADVFLPAVQPGAVLRHMLANAACMDTEDKLLAIPSMREFITNRDADTPDNFENHVTVHLLAWAIPASWKAPVFSQHTAFNPSSREACEMVGAAHMPVMFVVCLGRPPDGHLGVDITSWARSDPRKKKHILMKPPICVLFEQARLLLRGD